MKKLFFSFVIFAVLAATLPACSQDGDSLDRVRVSGDMTTVFRTGSGGQMQGNRTRTGIDF
ncbi:hypothetical protein [uncultured Mailhella sp.]|uniref:hypothetical protein n=1 Tax=uncultured Mailhella sp. TaxID=1981031 RepID=UPI0026337295|nr:hypothetical protein [uncultured Mailhella sp.]